MSPDELIVAARLALSRAYAPYSSFQVGAAVLTHDGRVFHGCNVENASYGLSSCAERTALLAVVAAGVKPGEFAQLAVIADTTGPVSPCGACRQVLIELDGPSLPVVLANLRGRQRTTTAGKLLPEAFGSFRSPPPVIRAGVRARAALGGRRSFHLSEIPARTKVEPAEASWRYRPVSGAAFP